MPIPLHWFYIAGSRNTITLLGSFHHSYKWFCSQKEARHQYELCSPGRDLWPIQSQPVESHMEWWQIAAGYMDLPHILQSCVHIWQGVLGPGGFHCVLVLWHGWDTFWQPVNNKPPPSAFLTAPTMPCNSTCSYSPLPQPMPHNHKHHTYLPY